MNKGIKAHISATLLYLIGWLIAFIGNDEINANARYVFAAVFFGIHLAIGVICYLEEYYTDEKA